MARRLAMAALSLALVAMAVAAGSVPSPAEQKFVCKIGKPSYCMKYFGVCQNEGGAACEAWQKACFTCHEKSSACSKGISELKQKPWCDRCKANWVACMDKTYVDHWPAKAKAKAKAK